MAKKKKRPARRRPAAEAGVPDFASIPPHLLRTAMEQIFGGSRGADDPEDRAWRLVAEAMASAGVRRERLAREAIQVSPDCAPAYVLLADDTTDPRAALPLYRQAVEIAQRAIDPKLFTKRAGRFDDYPETHVYLRARAGMASALWLLGEKEAALGHYRELLRLAASDEMGIRYLLASHLANLGRYQDLAELLARYDEDSTDWLYTRALLAFLRAGDCPEATESLRAAMRANPHVPSYLVGDVPLPEAMPESTRPGSESEAAAYAAGFLSGWRNAHGAITWLRRAGGLGLPKLQPEERTAEEIGELAELPQVAGEVWQADMVRIPQSAPNAASKADRFWAILVTCGAEDAVLAFELSPERPDDDQLWDTVLSAMSGPVNGEPHRPERIEFSTKKRLAAFGDDLMRLGIEVAYRKPLDDLLRISSQLERALPDSGAQAQPSGELQPDELLSLPRIDDETWEVEAFQMPTWVDTEQGPVRPWVALIAEAEGGVVIGHNVSLDQPSFEEIQMLIARSAARPMIGSPHRPGVVAVRSEDHRSGMSAFLQAAEIRCVVSDHLDALDRARSGLAERMGDAGVPALVESPGLEPDDVGALYEAAGEFYRRTPWRDVPGDTPIRIQCDTLPGGPWYAIVMGQIGIVVGLAIYDDFPLLSALISGRISQEEHSRRSSSLSVMFDEEFAVPSADLEAAEQFGWPVVAPEAYPTAIHVGPGREIRSPEPWELCLLQGALRAIPRFLADGNREAQPIRVPTSRGEARFVVDIP